MAKEHPRPENCLNCGERLSGDYCSSCGQENTVWRVSLWHLISDVLDDFVTPDSKLFRSLYLLIVKPGFLTREYAAGRRVRYVRPLRMYLIISVLYFFLLSFIVPFGEMSLSDDSVFSSVRDLSKNLSDSLAVAIPDSAEREEVFRVLDSSGLMPPVFPKSSRKGTDEPVETDEPVQADSSFLNARISTAEDDTSHKGLTLTVDSSLDSIMEKMRVSAADSNSSYIGSKFRTFLVNRYDRMKGMTGEDFLTAFKSGFKENMPKMMFFLLPVFALILKLIYPLSKKYYVEHLIFSLHFHAFAFLLMTLVIILQLWIRALPAFAFIGIMVYLFLAMRRAYGQSRKVTLLKFSMLLFGYGLALIFAFFSTIVATMVFL